MGKKLYVGNLPFSATDESLMQLFQQAGQVESARIITDRDTGRNKGFGFVEMSTEQAERRFFEVQARALGSQPSSDRKRAVAAAALWLAQARAASGGR